jgi:signal transduction histidine kinase
MYMPVQTGLVLALMVATPEMDFLPMLFFPLSFQAVQFFRLRLGLLWIGVFILAMAGPLLIGWDWELSGLAMMLLFAGLNFLMGGMAYSIYQARQARTESQRLLSELSGAYRQLQDYTAQLEEYAVSQERSRLRREMHDSITQTLFSMNLVVQAAQMVAGKEPGRVPEQLDRLQVLAREATGEIQALAKQPQPRPAAEGGLVEALYRLAAEREQRDGLHIHFEMSGAAHEPGLPEPVTAGLYRIAQEALNNVAKHAGVSQAFVRLNLEDRPAFLEIEDHGAGFDPDLVPRSIEHIGLPGMAERTRELGWKLKIISHPGNGTIIRAEEVIGDGATGA